MWEDIYKVSKRIGNIKGILLRNILAEIIFKHLRCISYDSITIKKLINFLDNNIDRINKYIEEMQYVWICLQFERSEGEWIEDIIAEISNIYDIIEYENEEVFKCSENFYCKMDKIKKFLPNKKGKKDSDRIKIGKKKKANKYELYARIHQMVMIGIKKNI